MKTLIKNVRVLNNLETRSILVEGEKIVEISSHITPDTETTIIDGLGGLVLPGLVNIHTHLDKAGLAERIVNQSGTIDEARKLLLAYKSSMTKEDIKERASRVIYNSIQYGVTAIRTHVDVDPIIGLKGIEALLELRNELRDLITMQIVAFPQEGITEAPGTLQLMRRALEMGADIVGGHLSIATDNVEHSKRVFDLAEEFDREIDVHVDYSIQKDYSTVIKGEDGNLYPSALGVVSLCEEKIRRRFPYKVTVDHLCGLDCIPPHISGNVIELIKKAKVNVIALPPNNLYCNGREDVYNVRRGVVGIKALLSKNINVMFGPDNIKDPFNPLGTPDMIQNAILTAYACHMANEKDYHWLLEMCTSISARLMQLEKYGLRVGCNADLVILNELTPMDILANHASARHVFRRGRLVYSKS